MPPKFASPLWGGTHFALRKVRVGCAGNSPHPKFAEGEFRPPHQGEVGWLAAIQDVIRDELPNMR